MYITFDLKNGIVYVPTASRTTDGLLVMTEPVAVVPIGNLELFNQALREAMLRGNPQIPRMNFGPGYQPIVMKYARIKSLAAFERGLRSWSIRDTNGIWTIAEDKQRRRGKGWHPDPALTVTLPPGSTIDEVCARATEILAAAAPG